LDGEKNERLTSAREVNPPTPQVVKDTRTRKDRTCLTSAVDEDIVQRGEIDIELNLVNGLMRRIFNKEKEFSGSAMIRMTKSWKRLM